MLIRIMIKMMIRMMIFVMTINIRKHIKELFLSFPFANVFSIADGPLGESSGTVSTIIIVIIRTILFVIVIITIIFCIFQIYMYTTPIEISFIDLAVDDRASITLSLAQVIIFTVTIVINIVIIMLNAHGTHLSELNQ